MSAEDTPAVEPAAPLLRVVNPDATPEEIAAIVAVFASLGTAAEAPKPPLSAWASPARAVRGTHAHGVGAWRSSGLPR